MRLDQLEEAARRYHPKLFYVIPTFQNPSGRTLAADRRRPIAEMAAKYGFIVAEDDPVSYTHLEVYKRQASESRTYMRMQPCEALLPMLPGLLVPWMPNCPHGTFHPRNRVPKPPRSPEKRLVI